MANCMFCDNPTTYEQRIDERSAHYIDCPVCGIYYIGFKLYTFYENGLVLKNLNEVKHIISENLRKKTERGIENVLTIGNIESYTI